MTRTKTYLGERAIVLGGSVSGMCCAKVLSSYFDEVVILERDAMPAAEADPTFRPGVSQSRHHHVLLAKGRENLASLFPGFDESLAEAVPRSWTMPVIAHSFRLSEEHHALSQASEFARVADNW